MLSVFLNLFINFEAPETVYAHCSDRLSIEKSLISCQLGLEAVERRLLRSDPGVFALCLRVHHVILFAFSKRLTNGE